MNIWQLLTTALDFQMKKNREFLATTDNNQVGNKFILQPIKQEIQQLMDIYLFILFSEGHVKVNNEIFYYEMEQ